MKTHRFSFLNRDGLALSAIIDFPVGEKPRAFAIFAHCFTCGKNLKGERNISLAMTQEGLAVFRFDFTGIGESEGEFSDTNFSTNVQDIVDAANYLAEHYKAPQLIVGHSLGGAAVLYAASFIPSLRAVATIAAPASPDHVQHLFGAMQQRINTEGEAQVMIAGRPFTIRKHFLEDIKGVDLAEKIQELKKPLLVMHSPQDQVVEIENAKKIYLEAWHPKSFLSLDGADHLLLRKADSRYAGNMIANWASRYLEEEEKEPLLTDKQAVVRTGPGSYTTEIRTGKHNLLADEPERVGGDDLGPSPYDLLLASLGTCTSMTLRMYADRKKWPLQEVRVHLEHYKDYPEDAGHMDDPKSKLDHIEREVELEGPLDEEQRARLLEIADRCPVHRTLHSEIVVKTKLREG
ncbi:MAG: bifunctional alpha/beta hydrolase/OsmC family protein [Bacteroidota bacterium]